MGQKVHPIGFRLGIYRDWDAQWFPRSSVKGAYGKELNDDLIIRKYLEANLGKAEIARIEIKSAFTASPDPDELDHLLKRAGV